MQALPLLISGWKIRDFDSFEECMEVVVHVRIWAYFGNISRVGLPANNVIKG
jgi:hypothetical protein